MYPLLTDIKTNEKQREAATQDYGKMLMQMQVAGMWISYGFYVIPYPCKGFFCYMIINREGKNVVKKSEVLPIENKWKTIDEAVVEGLKYCQKIISSSPPRRD